MSKTKLTKRTASKLVGTGLKVRLAGQQGVGLFTNKDMRTQRLPLYEEAALVTVKQKGSSVDNETLRMAVQDLYPAKQREFKFLPARGDVGRTSRSPSSARRHFVLYLLSHPVTPFSRR
jgi:hypothetical protein